MSVIAFEGPVSNISLLTPTFIGVLVASAVALAVAARRARNRTRLRRVLVAATAVAAACSSAAMVNDYFAYYPTFAALLGRPARDATTPAAVSRLLRRLRAGDPKLTLGPSGILKHGMVERVAIPGTRSHFSPRAAEVYLPPAWFSLPRPHLPVVVLLNGTPGGPDDWTRGAAADRIADGWAMSHAGVAPILVMPDVNGGFFADTECLDGGAGNAETYLTTDVPNWINNELGPADQGGHWAIGGLSEGGYCALELALRHPTLFHTFLDFGGLDRPTFGHVLGLFGHTPRRLRDHRASTMLEHWAVNRPPMAGWLECGGGDGGTTRSIENVARMSQRAGLPVHLVVVPGARHTFRLWHRALADAFPWTVERVSTGS